MMKSTSFALSRVILSVPLLTSPKRLAFEPVPMETQGFLALDQCTAILSDLDLLSVYNTDQRLVIIACLY